MSLKSVRVIYRKFDSKEKCFGINKFLEQRKSYVHEQKENDYGCPNNDYTAVANKYGVVKDELYEMVCTQMSNALKLKSVPQEEEKKEKEEAHYAELNIVTNETKTIDPDSVQYETLSKVTSDYDHPGFY